MEPPKSPPARLNWRTLGAVAGLIEVLALLGLVVATAVAAPTTSGWTADTSKGQVAVSEVIVYLLFSIGIAAVTWLFWQGRTRAWTPFALVQVFTLVAAWPLVKSDLSGYRVAGLALVVVGLIGLGSAMGLLRSHD